MKEERTMKKTLLFAAAVLALAACSKESPVKKEEGTIDASKLVFNIDVQNGNATKGVKTDWEDGDDVYVFFEDNPYHYVKMTYDGTAWTYKDDAGGTSFSGLILRASGKKLSAVYMPDFVCSAAPTYDYENDWWTFGSVAGYYQKAEAVFYMVTSTNNVTTLYATISLTAPANIMQFYVPSTEVAAPESGNEYVLTATHVINYTFNGIAPGGAAVQGNELSGGAMQAYAGTLGGDTGYYFWGILEGEGNYTYDFQLVKRNAEKKYAISSYSASKTPGVSISSAAFKLTSLTDNGNFVSLGYAGGPLWATGNLNDTSPAIAPPTQSGAYYKYGRLKPYVKSDGETYSYGDYDKETTDPAYHTNSSWRMPTKDEFVDLCKLTNTWDSTLSGRLFTGSNGIKLFFYAAGRRDCNSGFVDFELYVGEYWSSTPDGRDTAYCLYFNDQQKAYTDDDHFRGAGFSVRPVK